MWYWILKEVNIDGFSATMKTRIAGLREDPNSTILDELMNDEVFFIIHWANSKDI